MIYRFDEFELDCAQFELRKGGAVQRIEPQVFRLLEYLVANHQRVVTKDEINQEVWNGRIVSEAALNSRISTARTLIGDNGKDQRLIKTTHGQGFRFIGELAEPPSLGEVQESGESSSARVAECNGAHSIAVLPFDNMSSDPDQDFLADGICEDIITVLSKVPGLRVVARNSSFAYKGKSVDIRQVGTELSVAYVLEGSVRRVGNSVRVTAQLIDARTGHHVWAERYDRTIDNIFELQDELTREIVSALQISLTEGDRATLWARGTTKFSAWQKQVVAPSLINTQEKAKVLQGRQFAEDALAIDPDYSEAWAAIGMSYFVEILGGWGDAPEVISSKAIGAFENALALNAENPVALAGRGIAQLSLGNYGDGYSAGLRAYDLAPNSSEIASLFALIGLYCGEYDGLDRVLEDAIAYFPIYPAWYPAVLSSYHLIKGNAEKAAAEAQNAAAIAPDFLLSYPMLAIAEVRLGDEPGAAKAVQSILQINPKYTASYFAKTQPFKDKVALQQMVTDLKTAGLPA